MRASDETCMERSDESCRRALGDHRRGSPLASGEAWRGRAVAGAPSSIQRAVVIGGERWSSPTAAVATRPSFLRRATTKREHGCAH
ncbi:hypothetical protein Dimus_037428, partial [Dionaea muscipula]